MDQQKNLKKKGSDTNISQNEDVVDPSSNVIKVGLIGAGIMGKMLYQLFNGKEFYGKVVEVSISTRVPERFFKETLKGAKIFFDNARILKESDLVFLCAPKHCCHLIFSDIKAAFHNKNNNGHNRVIIFSIVGNLPQAKLDTYLGSERDSLAISAKLDYEKIEDA